jgi:hypothetical protein
MRSCSPQFFTPPTLTNRLRKVLAWIWNMIEARQFGRSARQVRRAGPIPPVPASTVTRARRSVRRPALSCRFRISDNPTRTRGERSRTIATLEPAPLDLTVRSAGFASRMQLRGVSLYILLDTVSRVEHDATHCKQRTEAHSNRHWRRRPAFSTQNIPGTRCPPNRAAATKTQEQSR